MVCFFHHQTWPLFVDLNYQSVYFFLLATTLDGQNFYACPVIWLTNHVSSSKTASGFLSLKIYHSLCPSTSQIGGDIYQLGFCFLSLYLKYYSLTTIFQFIIQILRVAISHSFVFTFVTALQAVDFILCCLGEHRPTGPADAEPSDDLLSVVVTTEVSLI